jgi:hypothetical protein
MIVIPKEYKSNADCILRHCSVISRNVTSLLRFLASVYAPILIAMASVTACAAGIWIGSIFVALPQRYAMLWIAISVGKLIFCRSDGRLVWFCGVNLNYSKCTQRIARLGQ